MGIPYSKEINKAFVELNKAYGQVTPLVAAAYEVLQTTKNISLLVAGIQVLNSLFLGLILLAMIGLLITVNPELEKERREIVTPTVVWVAGWILTGKRILMTIGFIVVMVGVGAVVLMRREGPVEAVEREEGLEAGEEVEDKVEEAKDAAEDEGEEDGVEEDKEKEVKRGWFGGKKEA
jgi:hypothetical protein